MKPIFMISLALVLVFGAHLWNRHNDRRNRSPLAAHSWTCPAESKDWDDCKAHGVYR